MKLTSGEFRALFKAGGGRVSGRGRPVIDLGAVYGGDGLGNVPVNRKVRNARKVLSSGGQVLADSQWEYRCRQVIEESGLVFVFQRKFELLPTVRTEGLGVLRKRTWTPDFTFEKEKVVADAKGFMTEMAPEIWCGPPIYFSKSITSPNIFQICI